MAPRSAARAGETGHDRAVLVVENLQVPAGDGAPVIRASLTVGHAETVCLTGGHGAGKTAMLHAIAGLLRPRAGSVVLCDRDVAGARPAAIARMGVQLIPERQRVLSTLTVEENLAAAALPAPGRAAALEDVYSLLPLLGRRRWERAAVLARWERKLLALGRALVARPSLLLLDEPSYGVAAPMADALMGALPAVNARGTAVLVAERDPRRALAVAGRGYVMDGGAIVRSGTPEEVGAPASRRSRR